MCIKNCCSHSAEVSGLSSAEESLLFYCKPVELYNILRRRSLSNPYFLRRCLRYETKSNRKRRRWDGVVVFNYRDHTNTIRKTEVTEDFSCPFCLMQCVSYKGLRIHLNSSHDLFNFEFWMSEDYRAVNVSLNFDIFKSETLAGLKHHRQSFFFCSNLWRRRETNNQSSKQVHIQCFELDSPKLESESTIKASMEGDDAECAPKPFSCEIDVQDVTAIKENLVPDAVGAVELLEYAVSSSAGLGVPIAKAQVSADPECSKLFLGNDPGNSLVVHASKMRKLTTERRALLQKRQFYHSHRVQPMALEQVLSDQDSEDEVDDEIADLEDRRMLDDFVDVSKQEKQLMHLWNSFVRKQRVIADGHVPWACEAFSKLHGRQLIMKPPLFWCWRFFLIKLWNHGLLDATAMNNCNTILQTERDEISENVKREHKHDE